MACVNNPVGDRGAGIHSPGVIGSVPGPCNQEACLSGEPY